MINDAMSQKDSSSEPETLWQWQHLEKATPEERDRILRAAAESARPDYDEGGDLTGFDANDEVLDF
jgi:hypothetical protein